MDSVEVSAPAARSAPWNSARSLRRAFMRAGVASIVLVLLSGLDLVQGARGWIFVPIALFEFWCRGWMISRRDAWKAGIGSFLLAFLLLLAAHFQALYAEQVVSARSVTAGLKAIAEQFSAWAREKEPPFHGGPNNSILVFYRVQCLAIACAGSLLWRPRIVEAGESVLFVEVEVARSRLWESRQRLSIPAMLAVAVPFIDWSVYLLVRLVDAPADANVRNTSIVEGVFRGLLAMAMLGGLSTVLLAFGSIACTTCMVFAWSLVDGLERALWREDGASPASGPP